MKQSKIEISASIIDAIADSNIITDSEKLNFLKYIGYLSYGEQKEFCSLL